ncbi:MAG TPA: sigma factor [Terriglobales bacterium]|nr:sigma factor [Terriglobales bacterium]
MRSDLERAISLLGRGDGEALEEALSLLQNTVFSFSMRVCGQREDAEDTMQEVLVRSLPYLPKFDSPKALVVWLYTVRVRLHRARLFVRKEIMKMRTQAEGKAAKKILSRHPSVQSHQPLGCKALFAELSNYLDEQLDDSLCSELEKHFTGCEPCKAFLASLEATVQQCCAFPTETPERKQPERSLRRLLSDYKRLIPNSNHSPPSTI